MTRTFTFRFERSKLTTKTITTTKEVTVDATVYDKKTSAKIMQNALHNDMPVSLFGWTLTAMLSLSYPDQLSSYSINDVKFAWGRTMVKYSRTEPSYADLIKEVKDLKEMVTSLKSCMQSQECTMLAWQTSNLVFHALGAFACYELADKMKAQLAEHSIIDFPGLFYLQSSEEHGVVEVAARMAYCSMHRDISQYALTIVQFKKNVGKNKVKIAHPTVSQKYLDEFINDLGSSEPNLSPLEVQLFDHLQMTSISTSNIQCARTG
ncbi:hypothetical protein PILCRDRAFT_16950 [Piloderma croceum F 1598]|uniref:Uncharacterized protein n=1 Tax=Piloderma croceum (strain F 1598) TaxID=765440 RepID=A0A0C3B2T3_PILCF|nr:hypothetical protein PILCRDRAFT_16950 [Piloderma croceum F 1598]